jgi:hypothetical protein
MEIAGIVANRLRMANRRWVDFASYPVKVRLARVLWEIATAYGHRQPAGLVVDTQLTQSELATMCGAAKITLQKAMRELRDADVVDTGYRQVIVRDGAALQRCAPGSTRRPFRSTSARQRPAASPPVRRPPSSATAGRAPHSPATHGSFRQRARHDREDHGRSEGGGVCCW